MSKEDKIRQHKNRSIRMDIHLPASDRQLARNLANEDGISRNELFHRALDIYNKYDNKNLNISNILIQRQNELMNVYNVRFNNLKDMSNQINTKLDALLNIEHGPSYLSHDIPSHRKK